MLFQHNFVYNVYQEDPHNNLKLNYCFELFINSIFSVYMSSIIYMSSMEDLVDSPKQLPNNTICDLFLSGLFFVFLAAEK